jgi:nucleoid-associated protein YgaU
MGDYTVWEELQTGWQPISPPELSVTLEASDEEIVAILVFVNKQVERDICIDGYKRDSFDGAGLPNWQMKLLDIDGNVVATTTTDGTGYYRFSDLEPGTYFVEETVQEGWWPTWGTSERVTVSFPPKHECEHANFSNQQVDEPPDVCVAWHVVQYGQTLAKISLRYGVPVWAIMDANGLVNPDYIWVGQKLCIPDP